MRSVILILILVFFVFSAESRAQTTGENVRTTIAPSPVFPDEAKKYIYGETIKVLVDVDKKGKVKRARALGPLMPCSDLKDPVVEKIRDAAIEAAEATVFEPILNKGKPVESKLSLTFPLRSIQAPLPPEDRMIIRRGVMNGKAKSLPQPEYPAVAKATRTTGSVTVQVLVGEDGHVLSGGAISGHPWFTDPGVRAACNAKFVPTTLKGEPAKLSGVLVYNFPGK